MTGRMDPLAVQSYAATLALLTGKYLWVTTLQARARFAARVFRWPEDASAWRGTSGTGGSEAEIVERAQAVLRNDAETQSLFLAASAAWVALGSSGCWAAVVLPGYALARVLHAWFFVYPRQPARNRAFVMSHVLLFFVLGDLIRRAWLELP